MRSWRARVLTIATAALALLGLIGLTGPAAAQAHSTPRYYVSLGDSLAFGYQPNLVAAGDFNPAHYRSYAEDLASIDRRLQLVNFGCPGETTTSMVNGGCPWPAPLHTSYGSAGSQLAAARAFLAAHPGQVGLISIDIGSNDLLALVAACQSAGSAADVQACLTSRLPGVLQTTAANYATILATVRALAPSARIVMFNLYNPLAEVLPGSDQLIAVVNQTLAQIATGAHVALADAFRAINGTAGSASERSRLCALTWECSKFQNVHPTTLGYAVMTVALVIAR